MGKGAFMLAGTAIVAAAILQCGTDSFAPGAGGADASADATASEGGDALGPGPGDAGVAETEAGGAVCASVRGPKMVVIPLATSGSAHYCIDSTEVTAGQYAEFLADPDPKVISGDCAWNSDLTPSTDAKDAGYPVTGVNQCDAIAFCTWAGKRLCGSTHGGPVDAGSYATAATTADSQWYRACSRNGSKVYPYGDTYVDGGCQVDRATEGPVATGSKPACVGGYPGLFDMSGNVDEWEDSCFDGGGTPESEYCMVRGSDYYRIWYRSRCDAFIDESSSGHPFSRSAKGPGFRCCKDE